MLTDRAAEADAAAAQMIRDVLADGLAVELAGALARKGILSRDDIAAIFQRLGNAARTCGTNGRALSLFECEAAMLRSEIEASLP